MRIERITNTHKDFAGLIREQDTGLYNRYGSQQSAYDQHNLIDPISNAIIGYIDEKPVACGCFKVIDHQTIEIKKCL